MLRETRTSSVLSYHMHPAPQFSSNTFGVYSLHYPWLSICVTLLSLKARRCYGAPSESCSLTTGRDARARATCLGTSRG